METGFLVPIKRTGNALPVYIVPSAGTTVFSLLQLAQTVQNDHPFLAFELSDTDNDIGKAKTYEEIAALFTTEIRSRQETGPYLIAGHCLGGIIAFEIAAQLEAAGETVAALLLLEAVPPGDTSTIETDANRRAETAKAIAELCDNVRENLSRLDTKVAARFGPLSWKLIDMSESYVARNAVKAPVMMLRTTTHPESVFQPWQRLTTGNYSEQIAPGDAFSMLAAPAVAVTAKRIDNLLQSLSSN